MVLGPSGQGSRELSDMFNNCLFASAGRKCRLIQSVSLVRLDFFAAQDDETVLGSVRQFSSGWNLSCCLAL